MKHLGDPKKQHKHYDSVKRPWDKDRILLEEKLVKKYGIRRKKEFRKAETILRNLRQRARTLIGTKNEKEESLLLKKVYDMGFANKDATIDTILGLKIESVLDRRLQTMLLKHNLANTPLQARQFIAHGHITVNGIKAISPSYTVKIHEENNIIFNPNSSLNHTFKAAEKEEPKVKKAPSKDDKKEKEPRKENTEPKKETSKKPKKEDKAQPKEKTIKEKEPKAKETTKKEQSTKKEVKEKK
ncbi:MAG: 30S ribosomal protein S4 [archaeon]